MKKVNISAACIFTAIDELARKKLVSKTLQEKLIIAASKYRKNRLWRQRFDHIDLQSTIKVTILSYESAIAEDPRYIEMEAITKCPDKKIIAEIFFQEVPGGTNWKLSINSYNPGDD